MTSRPANKSLHSAAYEHYLRTGEQMSTREWLQRYERKFNPYHDPKNGQFTFGPGGASLGQSARGVSKVPTRNSRAMSQHQVEAHADHAMDQYHRERARGKSPEEAAAWAANSEAESGGDPGKHQIGGGLVEDCSSGEVRFPPMIAAGISRSLPLTAI